MKRALTFSFSLAVIVAWAFATFPKPTTAQSGRRLPKTAATPAPSPQALPAEVKPPEKTKPALRFIVGIEHPDAFKGVPSYLSETVLQACASRLDEAPAVEVDVSHRDVNRGEAIKRAKAEKEAYVVWMHLRSDTATAGVERDPNQLFVEYVVYSPTTAKLATSGRTYQRAYGTGPVIMTPRVPGRASWPYIEQALKQAGREAAERILAALKTELPSGRVPT